MMEQILLKLAGEVPTILILAFFLWTLLQVMRGVLTHYQKLIDVSFQELTEQFQKLSERLERGK